MRRQATANRSNIANSSAAHDQNAAERELFTKPELSQQKSILTQSKADASNNTHHRARPLTCSFSKEMVPEEASHSNFFSV
jgi:hypothetical protein